MKKEDVDQEVPVPNDEITMKQLMKLLLETRKDDQHIAREQLKQTRPKSNLRPPNISAFNPQGEKDYPMPALEFDVLAPWPMARGKYHPLTVEEVTLMNRVRPGEVILALRDDTRVPCSIIATKNGTSGKIERIAFMGARDSDNNGYVTLFSKERRHEIPKMTELLRSVLTQQGTPHADVPTMDEIQRRIALPADDPKHLPVSVGE